MAIELFPNISDTAREVADIAFDIALTMDVESASFFLSKIIANAPTEEESEFYEFAFRTKMEALANDASNSDQR